MKKNFQKHGEGIMITMYQVIVLCWLIIFMFTPNHPLKWMIVSVYAVVLLIYGWIMIQFIKSNKKNF